jgi:hypothetical protein
MMRALVLALLVACGASSPAVRLDEQWPAQPRSYNDVVDDWTRRDEIQNVYQQVLEVNATFKSPEWRAAYAWRDAGHRRLTPEQRDQRMAQAQAETTGPYELELMVTTWDRRENDLDRGKRSIWRVVLVDDAGNEIEPLEIVKDKRPTFTVRADFPAFGDFATAYIARFPRDKPLLGPGVKQLRLRMSSARGSIELVWKAP